MIEFMVFIYVISGLITCGMSTNYMTKKRSISIRGIALLIVFITWPIWLGRYIVR